ncbi:MAG: hypothetical protein AAFZ67_10300, partial [Planctomycetota bacterium]
MPIVMLLALIIGLLSSVVLARAGQRSTTVRDQLASYQSSHRDRGVKELAAAWLMYTSNQDLFAMTGADGGPVSSRGARSGGDAFTVNIGRDTRVDVRIEPAQATARINPIGLDAADGLAARATERILRDRFGEAGLRTRTREVGPVTIDAIRAADDVLAALVEGTLAATDAVDAEGASRFVSALRRSEANGGFDAADVREAGDAAGFSEAAADRLAVLLTPDPTLWRVTATWLERDPARPGRDRREVYTGLINLDRQSQSAFGAQHPRELFLEWAMTDESARGDR